MSLSGLSICQFYLNQHLILIRLVACHRTNGLTWGQILCVQWTLPKLGLIPETESTREMTKTGICLCLYVSRRCWPHLAQSSFSMLVITVVLVMTAAILRDTQYINRLWVLIPEHNLLFHLQTTAVPSITSRETSKQCCFLKIGVSQFSTRMHVCMRSVFQELGASGK